MPSYPNNFSSTLTYERRYDLDEIDVFLEGDGNNPMFFSVSNLPDKLSFGKHYFNISLLDSSMQEYELTPNSNILFEFKSINNIILLSDIVEVNSRNGVITCYVEVLKDPRRTRKEIEDGYGTFIIAASLQEKSNTQSIPDKFKGVINYRCTYSIEIRKNLVNSNSPIIVQAKHKLESTRGQFSFAKASISTRRSGVSGNQYNSQGGVNSTNIDGGVTD